MMARGVSIKVQFSTATKCLILLGETIRKHAFRSNSCGLTNDVIVVYYAKVRQTDDAADADAIMTRG